jgi:hypothetical protein
VIDFALGIWSRCCHTLQSRFLVLLTLSDARPGQKAFFPNVGRETGGGSPLSPLGLSKNSQHWRH